MKPNIKESKIDFITRCISDELTAKRVDECQLIWQEHELGLEKVSELKNQTIEHIYDVDMLLQGEILDLEYRGENHDHTKLTIDALNLLKSCLEGTGNWKEWSAYHFKQEDHHPEYWDDKTDMPLTALIEMVADGASAYYARTYLNTGELPTVESQKQYFMDKKGWSEETATILAKQFIRYFNQLVELAPYGVNENV